MRPNDLCKGDLITIVFHPSEKILVGTVAWVTSDEAAGKWTLKMRRVSYHDEYYSTLDVIIGFHDDDCYTISYGDNVVPTKLSDYLLDEGGEMNDAKG